MHLFTDLKIKNDEYLSCSALGDNVRNKLVPKLLPPLFDGTVVCVAPPPPDACPGGGSMDSALRKRGDVAGEVRVEAGTRSA